MKRSDWLLLVLLSLPWGCSFLFFKVLAEALPPLTVAFGRVAIAAVALGLVLRQAPRVWEARRHWPGFLGMGLFTNAVPFTLIAWGAHRVSAGTEAISTALSPVLTVLAIRAAGRSGPLGWNRWAGVVLGFAGVVVLIGPDALGGASGAGVLACVAGAASYAVGALFMQDLRALPPLVTATAQLATSSALLLLPALLLDQPWTGPMPSATAWAALLGLALFSTAFAYILWFRLNASAGPANAMLVAYLIPVTALALDAAVLGEAITGRAVGGALLIAVGLAVLDGRWLPKRAEAAS